MSRRAHVAIGAAIAAGLALSPVSTALGASPDHLKQFKVPTAGSSPEHITLASDGNFWFTESFQNSSNTVANNLGRITPAGTVTEFHVCDQCFPTDVVQGSDGILYYTKNDAPLGRLRTTGEVLPDVGPVFSFNGNGLAAHGSDIWIADFNNGVMHRYNVTTGVMTGFTVPAPTLDVTVDSAGTVWFTTVNGPIGRLNPATGGVTTIDAGGTTREINVASDGFIWFTDLFGGRVGRINPTTNAVTAFAVAGDPEDIAPTAGGSMWLTQSSAGTIARITPAGVIDLQSKAVKGSEPIGITVAPNGDPWFTMLNADKIATFQLA